MSDATDSISLFSGYVYVVPGGRGDAECTNQGNNRVAAM